MTQKTIAIQLKNNHDPEPFHDLHKKLVHPLAASPGSLSGTVVQIPAWIDTMANHVAMKAAFLELVKPD
ncbi:MAG: hypothetical protein GYA24_00310 [Candidatus Lokiarchaeota archaeon]|nr:hypothetical protein [Candidatus Lokiarchaeota archaeon]